MFTEFGNKSDNILWQKFKAGDIAAFETIYRNNIRPLIHYGLKINGDEEVVSDAIQDLFIEIWHSRTHLCDTANINFYLIKALRYKLLKQITHPTTSIDVLIDNNIENSPETVLLSKEMQQITIARLRKAIGAISLKQQEIIYLRFFCGYSYNQMAELLNIKPQSVANLLHRSLESLKEKISSFQKTSLSVASFLFSLFL